MFLNGNEKNQNYPKEKDKIIKQNANNKRIIKPFKESKNHFALIEPYFISFLLIYFIIITNIKFQAL